MHIEIRPFLFRTLFLSVHIVGSIFSLSLSGFLIFRSLLILQVSLGLLGVITEVTLQCEPSFTLEETFEKRTLEDCLASLEQIADSAEHVKLWLEVYSRSCDIYRFERTEKEELMNPLIWRNLKVSSTLLYTIIHLCHLQIASPPPGWLETSTFTDFSIRLSISIIE